jgi:hypothetical protein
MANRAHPRSVTLRKTINTRTAVLHGRRLDAGQEAEHPDLGDLHAEPIILRAGANRAESAGGDRDGSSAS